MTPRIQLIAGLALLAFGVMLLAWSIFAAINPTAHYAVEVAPADDAAAKALAGLPLKPDVQRVDIRELDEKRIVASGLVARGGDGRLTPLEWRNAVTDPVFFSDMTASDLAKTLSAIRENVAEDAVIFAWWDLSRAIRLVSGRNAPLDDAHAAGLQIPASWKNTSAQEAARWGADADDASSKRFASFIDALLMDETAGADALTRLANGKPAYIAVHIADIYKIASARPGKLSVAYKDFASSSISHGVIKSAQQWLQEQKIDGGHAVEPTGGATRLHYLPRKSDGDALIVRLLPFSTSLAAPPTRFALVYQHKGWWVWRLNN